MRELLTNDVGWARRRRSHDELTPRLAVRDVRVRPDKKKGYYEVSIRGFGFRPWAAPPIIRIDGHPLARLRFSKDGTAIQGLVKHRPDRLEIDVDLGYARARWAPS